MQRPWLLIFYAGTGYNTNITVGQFIVLRILFNGASSKIIEDDGTPVACDLGTLDAGGITIGANVSGTSNSDITVKEAIFRKISDSTQDESDIYTYLKNQYSL